MAKCRRFADGNICDYFEYGIDVTPTWYSKGDLEIGTFVVKDEEDRVSTYRRHYEFMKFHEWVYIDKKFDFSVPCCRYKSTGQIFEYFVYHSDESPYMIKMEGRPNTVFPGWYDGSLSLVDGDVIVNHEGKGYVVGNSRRPEEMGTFDTDYEICGSIDRMFQYLDHR